jgi:hypothetical protein
LTSSSDARTENSIVVSARLGWGTSVDGVAVLIKKYHLSIIQP